MQDYKYLDLFNNILDGNNYTTQTEIDKFESEHQIKLTKDYVEFILGFSRNDRFINIDKGYDPCKCVSFKNKDITSSLGVINNFPLRPAKELINVKEILVTNIRSSSMSEDFSQDFYMILELEEYGVIYHHKFFELAMHYMYIKVANNFTELLENILNGRELPDDESDDFDTDEDEFDEYKYFTKEERKLTNSIPYYF